MPGLIINGKEEQVPGLEVLNYKDHPELKLKPGEDMRARHTRWIRSVVLHNTKNIYPDVHPGKGPSTNLGDRIARLWATDGRNAGAHISVDWDGTICCHCDLVQDAAYHASSMNEVSIGIEIYQDGKGVMYDDQITTVILLVRWLCRRFGIQMQTPKADRSEEIPRIKAGGENCVGVFGHCHQNFKDKRFDPGIPVFQRLVGAGFKTFDFQTDKVSHIPSEDLQYWSGIQKKLGLNQDGVPGPKTCDALQALGFASGIYDFSKVI
jgi:hypothetical protein